MSLLMRGPAGFFDGGAANGRLAMWNSPVSC